MVNNKRLFWAAEIQAPWPAEPAKGRHIPLSSRHLTLAFLGWSSLEEVLEKAPKPSFFFGLVGVCDSLLFLPPKTPRVVAGHVRWLSGETFLLEYHQELIYRYAVKEQKLLSHVTLARSPFDMGEWQDMFSPFPILISRINLYESVGSLTYAPLLSYPCLLPFEDLEHTADLAFIVRGKNWQELFLHAQVALAFHFPLLVLYFISASPQNLDDVVISLNQVIARADTEIGAPLKAVSFHGKIEKKNQHFEWEMIVDV